MFTEDLTPFFNPADFAEAATIGGTPVNGIFAEPSRDEVGIGGTQPTFLCATATLPPGYRTAAIVIRSRNFKVAGNPDEDESGLVTTLELYEQ